MADKNEKWKYAGAAFILTALVACLYGQPMQFMENQLGMECTSCGASGGGGVPADVTWDGSCSSLLAQNILTECCSKVPLPTCDMDIAGRCGGACPIPDTWSAAGWTSECVSNYPYYTASSEGTGGDLIAYVDECACRYYPPGAYTSPVPT